MGKLLKDLTRENLALRIVISVAITDLIDLKASMEFDDMELRNKIDHIINNLIIREG